MNMLLGMAHIFKKEGMCLLDVGWFRQYILVYAKEAAEMIFNDSKEQKKSDEHEFLRDLLGTGILTAPYGKWKKHRRILSPAFSSRVIDSFQPIMYDHASILVESIKSRLQRQPLVIDELLAKCSLGVITESAMGITSEAGSEENVAFVAAVRGGLTIIDRRIICPWLRPEVIFHLSPSGWQLKKYMKTLRSFVRQIIQKKKIEIQAGFLNNPNETDVFKRRPFLERLLLHNATCSEVDRLTEEDILDETLTFTAAGFDAVSTVLNWTIFYLGLHPEVMKKAWAEVHSILQGDKKREIRLDDVKQMDYLGNVIKEILRVKPAIATLLRTLRQDITIGEITLPKGATVALLINELHKRPDVFQDGERFDPDRFTDTKLNAFQYMPFSAGPRNCIGQRLAILEMKTVLSNLILHLDWRSLDRVDDVLSNSGAVERAHKPLKIHFWERL